MKLAKKNYYGGSLENIRNAPVTDILDIAMYEVFLNDYEEAFYELNNKGYDN